MRTDAPSVRGHDAVRESARVVQRGWPWLEQQVQERTVCTEATRQRATMERIRCAFTSSAQASAHLRRAAAQSRAPNSVNCLNRTQSIEWGGGSRLYRPLMFHRHTPLSLHALSLPGGASPPCARNSPPVRRVRVTVVRRRSAHPSHREPGAHRQRRQSCMTLVCVMCSSSFLPAARCPFVLFASFAGGQPRAERTPDLRGAAAERRPQCAAPLPRHRHAH
jgi:hypothetical protein